MTYGAVYEYWSSISYFPRGPVYALSAHQDNVFGNVPGNTQGERGRSFFTLNSGLTPPGNYTTEEHITAYFDVIGGTWEPEILADAVATYGVGPWSVYRENLHKNPSLETNATYWVAGAGNISRPLTGGYVGEAHGRITATGTGAFAANGSGTAPIPVVPGEIYTISAFVRGTVGRVVSLRVTWGGGAQSVAPNTPLTADWERLSYTVTVPEGTASLRLDILVGATGGAIGHILDFDGAMIEKSDVLGDYLDGDIVSTNELVRYLWSGTEHASSSIMQTRSYNLP